MLLFYSCLCFAISVATAFAAADNLFSDGNAQSLSTSLFTSEDLSAQSGNPNPTDLFQSSTELNPTQIGLSLVPAGSRDIFDFNSGGDLLDFNDDSLFSENLLAANDCGLDSSQVQGRVRARGTTCVNPSPGNAASGSSPQNNKPPEPDSEEPEPLAGGDINNWDKTCALNGLENIMVCSSGNPGDDTVQRLPVPNQGFVSLEWSSAIVTFLDWWNCLYPKKVWCCQRWFPLEHFRPQRLDPPRPFGINCKPPVGQINYR